MTKNWVAREVVSVKIQGNAISALLNERGVNQTQFAELVGTTPRTISRIVTGMTGVTFVLAMKMAAVLDVPVTDIFLMDVETRAVAHA